MTPGGDTTDRNWLPALTGLRIFAAVAVYFSHIGAPLGSPTFVTTFFASGYNGVTVFFVLSGFVLSLNYFDSMARPRVGSLWQYGVARVARVYPLYLLVLLYFMVRPGTDVPVRVWLEHLTALQAWDPDVLVAFTLNSPAWSISVEFFLYACFPLLVLAFVPLRRSPRRILVAGAVIVAVLVAITLWFVLNGGGAMRSSDPASAHRWLYRSPLLRLGDFSLGILTAQLFLLVRNRPSPRRAGPYLAGVGIAVILGLMAWPAHFKSAWSWDVSYAVPMTAVIFGLAIAPRGLLARGLARPAIVRAGEASYAFYLCQAAIIGGLGAGAWKKTFTATSVLWELMVLGLLLCLSLGLHVLFEKPARDLVRRWGASVARVVSRERATEVGT